MKILNKLTIKHLMMNKKRTIVTIIGILLSTALMVGFGLLVSSFRDFLIKDVKRSNGDYYLQVDNMPYSKMDIIDDNKDIKEYYLYTELGYKKFEKEQETEYSVDKLLKVIDTDDKYLEDLELLDGEYPDNKEEILLTEYSVKELGDVKVGDKISLDIGDFPETEGYADTSQDLVNVKTKEYVVSGIAKKGEVGNESDYSSVYYAFVVDNLSNDDVVSVCITSKKANKIYDVADYIKEEVGTAGQLEIGYNDSLLALYGASKYDNIVSYLVTIIIVILALVSVGCIIVIYNSFAISVMERKKQFGLFSSIGSTRKQLKYTVFYEALLVGSIGIVLGFLASFIGIGAVIYIMNNLMSEMLNGATFSLSVYPLFIIIPLIFMIVVISLSAYAPARKASKVSPVEAIRQNDDIKVNKKKIKTTKLARNLFGMESEIALKNIKRNKKKYRITIISLVTSIVLFISFSSLLNYMFYDLDEYMYSFDFDIYVEFNKSFEKDMSRKEIKENDDDVKEAYRLFDTIVDSEETKDYTIISQAKIYYTDSVKDNMYNKEYDEYFTAQKNYDESEFLIRYNDKIYTKVNFAILEDEDYKKLKSKNNIKNDQPLLINQYEGMSYNDGNRKKLKTEIYNSNMADSINICDTTKALNETEFDKLNYKNIDCSKYKLNNLYTLEDLPIGLSNIFYERGLYILLTEDMYEEMYNSVGEDNNIINFYKYDEETKFNRMIFAKVPKYDDLDETLSDLIQNGDSYYFYENIKKEVKQVDNMVLVIKILFYGFISLISLIGITSVFNTLNTSIALRRKEFAMLRSMGLTPKGFNKMIIFESVYFGFKSLLIGIPIGLLFTLILHNITNGLVTSKFLIPYESIFIAIFVVFAVVLLTMRYATNKIKHDNILDAIREENI